MSREVEPPGKIKRSMLGLCLMTAPTRESSTKHCQWLWRVLLPGLCRSLDSLSGTKPLFGCVHLLGMHPHRRTNFYNPFNFHLFPFYPSPIRAAVLCFPDPESPLLTPFDTSQRHPTPRRGLVCADRLRPAETARSFCLHFAAGAAEAAW